MTVGMALRFTVPAMLRSTALLCLCTLCSTAWADDATSDDPNLILGAGVQRMPAWMGASNHRNQPVPYIDAELPWHITLSTLDGLTVDFIHSGKWRGGFYGNYLWGRTEDELGSKLGGIVAPLSPRLQAGGYLEYQFTKPFSAGALRVVRKIGADAEWFGELILEVAACLQPRRKRCDDATQFRAQLVLGAAP